MGYLLMGFTAGTWEKCKSMNNSDGKKCAQKHRHIAHRHSWLGGWYGMLSHKDSPGELHGPNKSRPKRKQGGIWR